MHPLQNLFHVMRAATPCSMDTAVLELSGGKSIFFRNRKCGKIGSKERHLKT